MSVVEGSGAGNVNTDHVDPIFSADDHSAVMTTDCGATLNHFVPRVSMSLTGPAATIAFAFRTKSSK
jgi:hypothetical protein